MPIRTLIVDDEPLGRRRIRALLAQEADVDLIGECANGREAVAAIAAEAPDLVFLDVQMPVLDGFGVLRALGPDRMPLVIFVTAYDAYALRAFDVHALDYLLKPFDRERFREALGRVRVHLQRSNLGALRERLATLVAAYEAHRHAEAPSYAARLPLKDGGRVHFLDVEQVDWAEAAGNYVTLHVGRKTHLMRETMNHLEARLDPTAFIRIHRSLIVRTDRITSLKPLAHGGYEVTLRDGRQLQASRSYRDRLRTLMN